MREKIESMLKNPNIPLMTDEGISLLIDYIFNNKGNFANEKGPSRRIILPTGKTFKREKDLTSEEKNIIHKKVFKQIVDVMREDLQNYPDFIEILQSKNVVFKNFTVEDFVVVANLVQSGQIDDAISTKLGKYILEKNAMVVYSEYTGDFHMDLPYITKPQPSNKSDIRIYINTSNGQNAAEFLQEYAIRCAKQRIPYNMKGLYHTNELRTDGTILYVNIAHIEDVIKVLEEIKAERPELLETFGSPMISAHNEDYYAISSNPGPQFTYNLFADALSSLAFIKTLSERILLRYGESLPPDKKSELEVFSKDETAFNFSAAAYYMNRADVNYRIQEFFKTYRNQITAIIGIEKDALIPLMKEKLIKCSSLAYYGDIEHLGQSICFPKELYEIYHIDTINAIKEEKAELFVKEKRTKKVYSKEEVKAIFNADERQIRVKAMQVGYTFADTKDKTEQELRAMIFDKITLDNESMISILCGGDYQLKRVLVGYGTNPKELMGKSREELERMYIEIVGLDEIIAAREEVIKQDEISGEKRTHWYEITLQAMRMERGKTIMESDEFKSLKTKEEKRAFLDKLSVTELEDAERYYTTERNCSKIAEEIVPT